MRLISPPTLPLTRLGTLVISTALTTLTLSLTGCSGTPPTKHYRLIPIESKAERAREITQISLGVGPIQLPGYLDRAQIVTHEGQTLVHMHEFDQWVETLNKQLEDTLTYNLASLLHPKLAVTYPWESSSRPEYQLTVSFQRFGGSLKQVELEAAWRIVEVSTEQVKINRFFKTKILVPGSTVNAYVNALSRALRQFSREVIRELKALD